MFVQCFQIKIQKMSVMIHEQCFRFFEIIHLLINVCPVHGLLACCLSFTLQLINQPSMITNIHRKTNRHKYPPTAPSKEIGVHQ